MANQEKLVDALLKVKRMLDTPKMRRKMEKNPIFKETLDVVNDALGSEYEELIKNIGTELGMVERTNAMTGKKFMETEDTPFYASPRSETYWCS